MNKKLRARRTIKAHYFRFRKLMLNIKGNGNSHNNIYANSQSSISVIKKEPYFSDIKIKSDIDTDLNLTQSDIVNDLKKIMDDFQEQGKGKSHETEKNATPSLTLIPTHIVQNQDTTKNVNEEALCPVLINKIEKDEPEIIIGVLKEEEKNSINPTVNTTITTTAQVETENSVENLVQAAFENIAREEKKVQEFLTKKEKEPPPQRVVRDLNEKAQKRIQEIFPGLKDNGLIYAVFLAVNYLVSTNELTSEKAYTPEIYIEFIDLNETIKISRRRDLPRFIHQKFRNYFNLLISYNESYPKQSDETINDHKKYAQYLDNFIKRLGYEDLLSEFVKRINYDLKDYENGFPVKELIEYNENAQLGDKIQWINPALIESRTSTSSRDNESYRPYMNRLLQTEMNSKPRLVMPDETIFDTLAIKFPNFVPVIQYYKAQFRLNRFTKKDRISPVLLLGEPGIGKTHFAKDLARALKTGYTFIDMASTTDSWVLSGLHASWRGGKPGKFFEAMVNSSTLSPVVLLDEVEKTSRSGRYDATTPLYQILEETNAREFVDEFVDMPADLSHLIVIACANDLQPLSEPLQSRFRIFTVPSPTENQYYSILQSVYEDETAQSGVFEEKLSSEIIQKLLSCSIREAKVKIAEAIGQVLLELTLEEMDNLTTSGQKIRLKAQHLNAVLYRQDKMGF